MYEEMLPQGKAAVGEEGGWARDSAHPAVGLRSISTWVIKPVLLTAGIPGIKRNEGETVKRAALRWQS